MQIPHISVLPNAVLESFDMPLIHKGGILVDCTLGFGGHTQALLQQYPKLKIIGVDQDCDAIAFAKQRLQGFKERFSICKGRYSVELPKILEAKKGDIIGILADIGVSSMQFDNKARGFCFDAPCLDMRMDMQALLNAKDIVNGYTLGELEAIFRDYGEIREYKKLARLIVEYRKNTKFSSAQELSGLIARHFKHPKIHPATQAFQALRIAVNDELGELERFLETLFENPLQSGARVSVITFHSLEDRRVKNAFKALERDCVCEKNVMRCVCGGNHKKGKNLYKKPLSASADEVFNNPRSRSAKLRTFEFC